MLTRVFKSGNSLAVRIPKELAIVSAAQDVEIQRVGNTLVIRPAQRPTMSGLRETLAAFPRGFMREGREVHTQQERDWVSESAAPAGTKKGER